MRWVLYVAVRLLILRRIFKQNKMRIRRNVMKVKMMFLFKVMLNSARGMQIFGTMEKGVLVPDVSSPSLFTIQECVFIDIGKHKGFYAPNVEKSL